MIESRTRTESGLLRGEIRLRKELRTNAVQVLERSIRIVDANLSSGTLARIHRDLAVDLLDLTRERITEQVLTKLCDRLNRTRTTRTLAVVGGGLVHAVESLVAHAYSIS